jgi:hypothetical protein
MVVTRNDECTRESGGRIEPDRAESWYSPQRSQKTESVHHSTFCQYASRSSNTMVTLRGASVHHTMVDRCTSSVTSFLVLGRFPVCSIEDFVCYLFCEPVPEALLVPHWADSASVKFALLIQMVNQSADFSITCGQSDNSLTRIGLSPDQAHLVARLVVRLQHHIVVVLPNRQDRTCDIGSNISGLRPGRQG